MEAGRSEIQDHLPLHSKFTKGEKNKHYPRKDFSVKKHSAQDLHGLMAIKEFESSGCVAFPYFILPMSANPVFIKLPFHLALGNPTSFCLLRTPRSLHMAGLLTTLLLSQAPSKNWL